MSLPVHLVPSLEGVRPGALVEVTGDEAHHAVTVRRLRVGEKVVLTDGRGRSGIGTVLGADRSRLTVELFGVDSVPRAEPSVTVVQALPRGDRGELAVEVLTEVGVDRIVPWGAARCVAVWRGERAAKSHARWAATAREAAKQARRSWFPVVAPLASTAAVAELVGAAGLAVVLHEEAARPLPSVEVPSAGEIVVVVGPEGGLTPEEVEVLAAAGGQPVRLGSEVLRTSTAGLAAASALLARTPRWS